MRKQEQEELRRLEEALMAHEYTEEIPAEEKDILEDTWLEVSDIDYEIYNTDDTDVDLEAYSEDVHRGRRSNVLPTIITLLALAALSAMILWLLRYLGVL